jgi:acyl carrier protein
MRLFEVIAEILKVDKSIISDESNALNTPNWDSLRHIELMLAVETAFDVRFAMPEMVGMRNVGDMRSLLVSKGVPGLDGVEMRKSA